MAGKYRELTPEEELVAANAKRLFNYKKKDLHLTQIIAAPKLGISQGTLTQYLNAVIPCNRNFITNLANLLEIDPTEIDPGYNHALVRKTDAPVMIKRIPLLGTTSGQRAIGSIDLQFATNDEKDKNFYAVLIDTELAYPTIPLQSVAVADPLAFLRSGTLVTFKIRNEDSYDIGSLIAIDDDTVAVLSFSTGEKIIHPVEELASLHRVSQIKLN